MNKNLLVNFILFLARKSRFFKRDLLRTLRRIKFVLKTEGTESKEMLRIYQLMIESKASKEQIKWANSQFRDILKTAGLGFFIILPLAPITIPVITMVSKKLNISIFPKSFTEKIDEENDKSC